MGTSLSGFPFSSIPKDRSLMCAKLSDVVSSGQRWTVTKGKAPCWVYRSKVKTPVVELSLTAGWFHGAVLSPQSQVLSPPGCITYIVLLTEIVMIEEIPKLFQEMVG